MNADITWFGTGLTFRSLQEYQVIDYAHRLL
jgi:hypothetical protein